MGEKRVGAAMDPAWKKSWDETKRHFREWWNREGLVIGGFPGSPAAPPHEQLERPERLSRASGEFYSKAALRARCNHYGLSRMAFPADLNPAGKPTMMTGSRVAGEFA
jgi:hypothetical protein